MHASAEVFSVEQDDVCCCLAEVKVDEGCVLFWEGLYA